jgi:ribosome biogenesis protein Tsr3
LEDYSAAEDRKEIVDIESQYFGNYVLESEGKS